MPYVRYLFLMLAFAGAACAEIPTPDGEVVLAERVKRRDLSSTITLTAELRPFLEVSLHAKVAGFLKEITVDRGDRVEAGQVIATLEIPEATKDVAQAEASRRRAADEVARAQTEVQRAVSAHDAAHLTHSRLRAILKARPKLVAEQDLDDADAKDRIAEAMVATSRAAVSVAERGLESAQAYEDKMRAMESYARIVAPFRGVITHRFVHPGAMIQAGTASQSTPLVRLSQNDRLRLVVAVPESVVSQVRVGTPVDVRVSSSGARFTLPVVRLSNHVETGTRTMEVEVDVPNANFALVPGMYASAALTLEHHATALSVPVGALVRREDEVAVMRVGEGGKLERLRVTPGLETPSFAEVAGDVKEGDVVVVGRPGQLQPGQLVIPRFAEEK